MLLLPTTVIKIFHNKFILNGAEEPFGNISFQYNCPVNSLLTIVDHKIYQYRTVKWVAYIVLFGSFILRTGYNFHLDTGEYLDWGSSKPYIVLAQPIVESQNV